MRSPPIWRLVPGQRLVHRCHDGECVLFNDLTGDTHLLDESALALLEALRQAPQSAADLAGLDGLPESDPTLLAELDDLLADLAALSLVDAAAGGQPC